MVLYWFIHHEAANQKLFIHVFSDKLMTELKSGRIIALAALPLLQALLVTLLR